MMKRTNDSSYKNLYSGHVKTQSRPKLSSSSSSVKLNAPQYLSNKQNEMKNVNRIHTQHQYQSLQPRMRREFKLYSQLQEQDKPSLKQKVQRLQQLLQKKISEQGFMSYFKTSNSSKQMNHIDIYCKIHELQQKLMNKSQTIKQLERKVQIAEKQIQNILCVEQQKRQKHLKQVKTFTDVINKLMATSEESKQYKIKYQQIKILLEQFKKQRLNHLKQLQQQSNCISSRQQQLQSIRDELQKMNLRYEQQYHKNQQLQECINGLNITISSKSNKIMELQKHAFTIQQNLSTKNQVTKEQIFKTKALQQIIKSNESIMKQKQMTIQKQSKLIQQYLQKIQCLQIQRDYQKCQRLKTNQQSIKLKVHIDKLQTNLQSNQTIKRTKVNELDVIKKQKIELQQTNIKLKIQNEDMLKQISEIIKQKNTIVNQLKQSTLNEKKLNTEKYRFIMKLQEHLIQLKQFNTHTSKQQKDTDKILGQIGSIVINIKQKLQEMEIKISEIELQKQSKSENAIFNIEIRQQTTKILLKFIPEDCWKLVEDYLDVTEEIIRNPSNGNIIVRNQLIGKLEKQSWIVKQNWKKLQFSKQKLQKYEETFRKNQKQKQREKQREKQIERQRQRQRQQQISRKRQKQIQQKQLIYQIQIQQQKQKQKQRRQRQKQRQKQRQLKQQREREREKQRQLQKQNQNIKLNATQVNFKRQKLQSTCFNQTLNTKQQDRIKRSVSKAKKYFD